MYDLEIASSTDRLNTTLDILQQDFPRLDVIKRSITRYFCVFACTMPQQLNEHEKAILEQYIETKMIYRYRCGKIK
jgi:hypothetical protein